MRVMLSHMASTEHGLLTQSRGCEQELGGGYASFKTFFSTDPVSWLLLIPRDSAEESSFIPSHSAVSRKASTLPRKDVLYWLYTASYMTSAASRALSPGDLQVWVGARPQEGIHIS